MWFCPPLSHWYRAAGLLLWLAAGGTAYGQADAAGGLPGQLARYQQAHPSEKLFLHLDQPAYAAGETIWLKAYATDATSGQPLAISSVAYVEVLAADNRPVLQAKLPLRRGVGQGSLVLPASLASGRYTVRGYTNWMKNDGPEHFFQASITVLNGLAASGNAPDSLAPDVQLFPEGGHLVQQLRSTVGFKVCDAHGQGLAATGQLLGPQGQVLATVATQRFGMGRFELTPTAGQPGTLRLTLADGRRISRPLPVAQPRGYVLRLHDASPTQLVIDITATAGQAASLTLLAHQQQRLLAAQVVQLQQDHAQVLIDKALLHPGLVHFTVFDAQQQPWGERLYFVPPASASVVQVRTDQPRYAQRARVAVQLATSAPTAEASLSMAVYRLDSLSTALPSIAASLLLTSDLRGFVESPDYYLGPGAEVAQAADNLMLTQGWSRFDWREVLGPPKPPQYLPELRGPLVQARLAQAGTGAPRPGLTAYLAAPGQVPWLSTARSNADGLVQFETPDWYGTQLLTLQTDPQQDSTAQLTLLSPFASDYARPRGPGFHLAAGAASSYSQRHLQAQVQQAYYGNQAPRFAASAADTLPFYGPANEVYLLDRYTRFKVLEEVLREYVPGVLVHKRKDGFHLAVVDRLNKTILSDNPLLLLDGVPVFNTNKLMAINPLKIRRLEVVTGNYFHGLTRYLGIVSFSTYQHDLEGFELAPQVLMQQYESLQRQREFYAPRYETAAQRRSRLPDLRHLLYWNPNLSLTPGTPLDFYTGDQSGRYLVVVQGVAADGQLANTTTTFTVTADL